MLDKNPTIMWYSNQSSPSDTNSSSKSCRLHLLAAKCTPTSSTSAVRMSHLAFKMSSVRIAVLLAAVLFSLLTSKQIALPALVNLL